MRRRLKHVDAEGLLLVLLLAVIVLMWIHSREHGGLSNEDSGGTRNVGAIGG